MWGIMRGNHWLRVNPGREHMADGAEVVTTRSLDFRQTAQGMRKGCMPLVKEAMMKDSGHEGRPL